MIPIRLLAIVSLLCLACAAPVQPVETPPRSQSRVDTQRLAAALSAAIQIPTISGSDPTEFAALEQLLRRAFPQTFGRLRVQRFPGGSLLMEWPGKQPDQKPYLLMAHLDVVPVSTGSESDWSWPPFSGAIEEGFVWGRGALDCKGTAIAILTAVEGLLASGFQPDRTVFLAFGADEEVGGRGGAGAMAASLRDRSVRFLFTLDEGTAVLSGLMPGLEQPTAIIGVAEKGYATFQITARAPGGHSSMPPPSSAAGKLARAIVAIEDSPLPADIDGPTRAMLEALGPHMDTTTRLAIAALPVSEPLILQSFEGSPALSAQVRTTTAVTMVNAGTKENVLPQKAQGIVNFRLRPGDTVEDVRNHLLGVVDSSEIEISLVGTANEASPVAALDSVPGLVVGGTDTRHYVELADASLRFGPMRLGPEDLPRIHGTNERIAVENLAEMTRFYRRLILDTDQRGTTR